MYKIIGADGREYGPVTADQLRQWIREGRANGQTNVQVEGETTWKPLSSVPELSADAANLGAPPMTPATGAQAPSLPTTKTCGMAVAGLVMGILSLIQCCSFIFGILGVTFSSIGLSQIKKQPAELMGKGLAIAGLITSIAGLAINIVLIIVYKAAILAALAGCR